MRLSPLEQDVAAFFAADGPLALTRPHYRPRAGQLEMALAVAQAIDRGEPLVVEAGTGVGKTYAYLVPALLSGRRCLLSTGTKTLQDQLFTRDLPAVCALLGRPVRTALLKGRASYLCQHRFAQAAQHVSATDGLGHERLRRLQTWATHTQSGDLDEGAALDERSPLRPLVTSTRDNCLGSACDHWRECHVNQARRAALAADVVVVNHHLFFADLAVKESGVAELLPQVDVVVFDEAHRLNDAGVWFLGSVLTSAQLNDLARELRAQGNAHAPGLRDWSNMALAVERSVQALRGLMPADADRRDWTHDTPDGLMPSVWRAAWIGVDAALSLAADALETLQGHQPDLDKLAERTATLRQRLHSLVGEPAVVARARWLECSPLGWRLVQMPLDAAAAFQHRVWPESAARPTAWVFTSASLGHDEQLSWFTQPLGLQQARTLQVPSPFDYAAQAAVYVPPELPAPADPAHSDAVAHAVWRWAVALGGRTLVLATTLRAMQRIGERLTALASASSPQAIEVLVQGQWPKRELLRQFERAALPGAPGAVLVASASFWEGVDLPGDCLQLVVIDKLPFPPPDDPWVQARCRAVEEAGEKPFTRYFVPEAAVALKQGAGRLIRTETDRGVLVVCDVRLRRMGYGRVLLRALPPMRPLQDEAAMQEALTALRITTVSTTTTRVA